MTGEALGAHGAAIPVETVEVASSRPGFFGKLLGRKPKREVVYVCCPACAAQVEQNPRLFWELALETRRKEQRERETQGFSAGAVAR